ncbi:MAG: histidinol-phosphate transaminase [Lachnospiraceae bacterium]|nr:histidinol-phosphate transaminase [Lachnospiraceae bacterium]
MSYEDNVRKVVPYTPGEQPQRKVIKLNTNECPYTPSPKVAEALKAMDISDLRKYPDPLCSGLVSSIAEYYGLKDENVFVGVGSDDVLSMCFLTFFNGKDSILFPDITYSFYDVWAEVYDIPYKTIPLREDFSIDPADYRQKNGGIVIANPNAPTGREEKLSVIEEIISSNPDVMVIVDEAYVDFGSETALPLLDKYENMIIVRTMSKSRALAGIRIGYAFGSRKAIKYLNDVKFSVNSYTMNTPSLLVGRAAMEDVGYFKETLEKVINTRERVKNELKDLGFFFADSKTNFIFAGHEGVLPGETQESFAARVFESLKQRDIFVRYFNKPRVNGYLRISIGTDDEMDELIRVLKELI